MMPLMVFVIGLFALDMPARAQTETRVGRLILGWDLDSMSERPSVAQEIEAGRHQLSIA
jgi:hypothetical protein